MKIIKITIMLLFLDLFLEDFGLALLGSSLWLLGEVLLGLLLWVRSLLTSSLLGGVFARAGKTFLVLQHLR
jgi:hypothetical protein